eukprot:scaffold193194_cov31-Prasinocladus_malaysianus.AAC.1
MLANTPVETQCELLQLVERVNCCLDGKRLDHRAERILEETVSRSAVSSFPVSVSKHQNSPCADDWMPPCNDLKAFPRQVLPGQVNVPHDMPSSQSYVSDHQPLLEEVEIISH